MMKEHLDLETVTLGVAIVGTIIFFAYLLLLRRRRPRGDRRTSRDSFFAAKADGIAVEARSALRLAGLDETREAVTAAAAAILFARGCGPEERDGIVATLQRR